MLQIICRLCSAQSRLLNSAGSAHVVESLHEQREGCGRSVESSHSSQTCSSFQSRKLYGKLIRGQAYTRFYFTLKWKLVRMAQKDPIQLYLLSLYAVRHL